MVKKLSVQIYFENLQGAAKNPIFERFWRHFTLKWFMEKSCLRQLEALINSFTFYPKRFFKKPLYRVLWPKIRIIKWNCIPPVGQKSEIAPKFFPRLFILGLALSIAKVSTRSGCYTWKTSLVSFQNFTTPIAKIYNWVLEILLGGREGGGGGCGTLPHPQSSRGWLSLIM